MKTVLRNNNGEITHQRVFGNYFATKDDLYTIISTPITTDMFNNLSVFERIKLAVDLLNGDIDQLEAKYMVLKNNGYNLVLLTEYQIELISIMEHYVVIKECVENKTHLIDCDDDGYCNYCGYQETLDDLEKEKENL